MKKIKINEKQANLLKEIKDSNKVLKVTQEQYNKILQTEGVTYIDEAVGYSMDDIKIVKVDDMLCFFTKDGENPKFNLGSFAKVGFNHIFKLKENEEGNLEPENPQAFCEGALAEFKEMELELNEGSQSFKEGDKVVGDLSVCVNPISEDVPHPIDRQIQGALKGSAKTEFNKAKIPGLREMYEEFINELYNINEGSERRYESLIGLMEAGRFIQNRKINKESFSGNKEIVENAISSALYEMSKGGDKYVAMSKLEETIRSASDITPEYLGKQLAPGKKTGKSPEELKKSIALQRANSNKQTKDTLGYDPESEVVRDEALDSLADGMKTDQHDMKKETAAKIKEDEGKTTWTGEEILSHPVFAKLPTDVMKAYGDNRISIPMPSLDGGHSSSIANYMGHVLGWIEKFTKQNKQEPILDVNLNVLNKGFQERDNEKLANIGKGEKEWADKKKLRKETDADSSGSVVGTGAVVDKKKAVHRSNAISSLDTKDEYIEVEAGDVDEMTSTTSVGNIAIDHPGAIGGNIKGEDPIDMHPEGSKGPTMPMIKRTIAENDSSLSQSLSNVIPENTSYKDFAIAVSDVVKNDYGTHNFVPFLKTIIIELDMQNLNEDAFKSTQYKGGSFVGTPDCAKLNNNKDAQNGGCNSGDINILKLTKTKNAVISNDHIEEVSKKTGRSIDEVKKIIESSIK